MSRPETMARKPITNPPSLGDLSRQVEAIACWCHGCGRRASVPIGTLIAAHGEATPFVDIIDASGAARVAPRMSMRARIGLILCDGNHEAQGIRASS
jgi:hypothetical protein